MRAVTASQMRRIDRLAQEVFGIPETILMEHAGAAVASEAKRLLKGRSRARRALGRGRGTVVVLAGGGANGGDGLVAARHLDNAGIPVEVAYLARPPQVASAVLTNFTVVRRLKIPFKEVNSLRGWQRWANRRRLILLVIDALLGTGVKDEVREPIRSAIGWINAKAPAVIAVDLPSGLCADSGKICGVAVSATVTVTCGIPKVGLAKGQGPDLSGRVVVADLSLPRALKKGFF